MSIYSFCFLFYLQDKTNVILRDKNYKKLQKLSWRPQRDSNPRPLVPKTSALNPLSYGGISESLSLYIIHKNFMIELSR